MVGVETTGRKHCYSTDDELQETSKRRKHRHSSRDHGEERLRDKARQDNDRSYRTSDREKHDRYYYESQHRHRRNDSDKQQHRSRRKYEEPEKQRTPRTNNPSAEDDNEDKFIRDEAEGQNMTWLRDVDQEEEDLDRIIQEESRRRRQAILDKYKHTSPQEELAPIREEVAPIRTAPEATTTGDVQNSSPKSERSSVTVCDDDDDIFAESPAGVCRTGKGDEFALPRSNFHHQDNWDDAEGYYMNRFGEVLDSRYEVIAAHGKGVYSTVVRAKDAKAGAGDPREVAIKIVRNNETMRKAGEEELIILKKLVGADPEDKRHCVRYLSSFMYRNHLCIVFESLSMNLREVIKKFGRDIGLKLTAVRAYAKQLFIALKHLHDLGVLHCDIKPDNILVNEAKNVLKLCDFGTAMFVGNNEITPYLVSRFYRAPEIILGLPYDHALDMWSVGCCLFELYTGKIMFPGATNHDMLRLHMELKGCFPKKMLRKGGFTSQHFDRDLNFLDTEDVVVAKRNVPRSPPPMNTGKLCFTGYPGEDPKLLADFKDLLGKAFVLDPEKRITVSQALSHPFITLK